MRFQIGICAIILIYDFDDLFDKINPVTVL